MFVPNFEAISHVTLVLELENRQQVWRKKRSQSNAAKYGKKYFIWLYVLRYPSIPTNPLLAAMSFFFLFFLPGFCTLFFS